MIVRNTLTLAVKDLPVSGDHFFVKMSRRHTCEIFGSLLSLQEDILKTVKCLFVLSRKEAILPKKKKRMDFAWEKMGQF